MDEKVVEPEEKGVGRQGRFVEFDVRDEQSYMNLHYGNINMQTRIKKLDLEVVTWGRRHLDFHHIQSYR